jgi:hypothetical protein
MLDNTGMGFGEQSNNNYPVWNIGYLLEKGNN